VKVPKWLAKIQDFVSGADFSRLEKRKHVHKLLEKLRKRRDKLRKRLEAEEDPERRQLIEKSLELVQAQRRKGLKVLKTLKKRSG